jgi:integrase
MDEEQCEIIEVLPATTVPDSGLAVVIHADLERLRREVAAPPIVQEAGPGAEYAYADFFKAKISNPNTRKAYKRAVDRFSITWPRCGTSSTTSKMYHGVGINPASSVRGPKYSAREGKTPAFHDKQVRDLIDSVDATDGVGTRDRTPLMILAYTAARAGAVVRLRTMDYITDGRSWSFNFGEKGGKLHQVPVRHDLQLQMEHYLRAAGLEGRSDKTPLFRTAAKKKKGLMMDSGVVVRRGLRVVTFGLIRRAPHRLDLLLRPAPEALTDGEYPGPLRRPQVLPDDPGDALARRRDLSSLLLGFGHQEWSG